MLGQERHRPMRNNSFILDTIHIVIGILIVILGVISFLDPEGNLLFLPVIFLLAAVLDFINGFHKMRSSNRDNKKKISAVILLLVGVFLVLLAVVSAISIWRR